MPNAVPGELPSSGRQLHALWTQSGMHDALFHQIPYYVLSPHCIKPWLSMLESEPFLLERSLQENKKIQRKRRRRWLNSVKSCLCCRFFVICTRFFCCFQRLTDLLPTVVLGQVPSPLQEHLSLGKNTLVCLPRGSLNPRLRDGAGPRTGSWRSALLLPQMAVHLPSVSQKDAPAE